MNLKFLFSTIFLTNCVFGLELKSKYVYIEIPEEFLDKLGDTRPPPERYDPEYWPQHHPEPEYHPDEYPGQFEQYPGRPFKVPGFLPPPIYLPPNYIPWLQPTPPTIGPPPPFPYTVDIPPENIQGSSPIYFPPTEYPFIPNIPFKPNIPFPPFPNYPHINHKPWRPIWSVEGEAKISTPNPSEIISTESTTELNLE